MPLLFNTRHVERDSLPLRGELPVAELGLEDLDELVRLAGPVQYDLVVEKLDKDFLVQGRLVAPLRCQCARCLREFDHTLLLERWVVQLPTEGEEAVAVVNDSVDLTPHVREDILLELPQHPLCAPDCGGLQPPPGSVSKPEAPASGASSVWDALDKLNF